MDKGAIEALRFDFDENEDEPPAAAAPQGGSERSTLDPTPREDPAAGAPSARERRIQGLQLARDALESGRAPEPASPDDTADRGVVVVPGASPESALSVPAFYDRLRLALRLEFPDDLWVTGEIRKVTVRNGNRYIELADHEHDADQGVDWAANGGSATRSRSAPATLEVSCWSREWPTIAARLDDVGVELTPGLVIRVRGRVSVWDAGARIRFSMFDLDVEALVGGIAAARRKLLAALAAEGMLEANRRLPLPQVPLRVGIVTSASSEAYRDFTGQLDRSGLAFSVHLESSLVQGSEAPLQIAAALRRLQRVELDLVVLVRGGGAKGDLAAFDHEAVARAIVTCRYPIWTGIGHTGDQSVADELAHRALVTPTACGEAVVRRVLDYLEALSSRSERLAVLGERALDAAAAAVVHRRSDLSRAARYELTALDGALAKARGQVERGAAVALERCTATLSRRASRIGATTAHHLGTAEAMIERQRAMLTAFDPRRQLERGWSLTRRRDGSILRSVAEVRRGDEIVTVLKDGSVVAEARTVTEDSEARPVGWERRARHVERSE
jgi:exodeoxyribonuclease VII large subunit